MFCPHCGKAIGESQPFCRFCGARLPSTTEESPPKRKPSRFTRNVLLSLGILLALIVLEHLDPPKSVPSTPTVEVRHSSGTAQRIQQSTVVSPGVEPTLPDDEREFISLVSSFRASYAEASNEFQKSTVRRARAEAISRVLPSRSVKDWVGQVSAMQTTSDGLGILFVKLPGDAQVKVETMNNRFSDIGENTLIRQGSLLYNQVASLAVGDELDFSGRFSPRDQDYIEEISMTEEGSMTEPDFIFTFITVSKKTP